MNNFEELNLPEALQKSIEAMGFTRPTPIQAKAIPAVLTGRDVIGCAETGSGKTVAFCLPMFMHLMENPEAQALILAPTRELATQISTVVRDFIARAKLQMKYAIITGGASMKQQLRMLSWKPRVFVGTPGRINDLLRRRNLSLTHVSLLILDEGDRMLDMGFAPQIDEIVRYTPKERQTILFTATFPKSVQQMVNKYLKTPIQVNVGTVSQPSTKIKQSVLRTTTEQKNNILLDELNRREGSVIIFTRTKRRTDKLTNYLAEYGYPVTKIHGDCSQNKRNTAIADFRAGKYRILVATDVASRGLDVPHIAHVINYDLPECREDYVHRIGRTGRAGAQGESLSLITPDEAKKWANISGERQSNANQQQGARGGQGQSKGQHMSKGHRQEARTGGRRQGHHKPHGSKPRAKNKKHQSSKRAF